MMIFVIKLTKNITNVIYIKGGSILMELKNVLFEKEGNLAIVTINRPKALNALNSETLKDLDAVIADLENDNNIYCVILTGAGKNLLLLVLIFQK